MEIDIIQRGKGVVMRVAKKNCKICRVDGGWMEGGWRVDGGWMDNIIKF